MPEAIGEDRVVADLCGVTVIRQEIVPVYGFTIYGISSEAYGTYPKKEHKFTMPKANPK